MLPEALSSCVVLCCVVRKLDGLNGGDVGQFIEVCAYDDLYIAPTIFFLPCVTSMSKEVIRMRNFSLFFFQLVECCYRARLVTRDSVVTQCAQPTAKGPAETLWFWNIG
jgi:hypothetical protein